MAFEDVLVHTARPVSAQQQGPKVAGRPRTEDVLGTPFDACLFLPSPSPESERQGKRVKRPTLLIALRDRAGELLELSGKGRVSVLAPELTGPVALLWQLEGDVQPFGPPGDEPVGMQATLRRVED